MPAEAKENFEERTFVCAVANRRSFSLRVDRVARVTYSGYVLLLLLCFGVLAKYLST